MLQMLASFVFDVGLGGFMLLVALMSGYAVVSNESLKLEPGARLLALVMMLATGYVALDILSGLAAQFICLVPLG